MEIYGSLDKGDYEAIEVPSTQGIFLGDNEGMGVELADDSWFV